MVLLSVLDSCLHLKRQAKLAYKRMSNPMEQRGGTPDEASIASHPPADLPLTTDTCVSLAKISQTDSAQQNHSAASESINVSVNVCH